MLVRIKVLILEDLREKKEKEKEEKKGEKRQNDRYHNDAYCTCDTHDGAEAVFWNLSVGKHSTGQLHRQLPRQSCR